MANPRVVSFSFVLPSRRVFLTAARSRCLAMEDPSRPQVRFLALMVKDNALAHPLLPSQTRTFLMTNTAAASASSSLNILLRMIEGGVGVRGLTSTTGIRLHRQPAKHHHDKEPTLDCVKCMKANRVFFCSKCGKLFPPRTLNYFELFMLPVDYELDIPSLNVAMKEAQKLLHPDKYTQASEEQKSRSAYYSSLVNKAYETLRHPNKRALYLLELKEHAVTEEDQTTDMDLIEAVMEINEAVEGAATMDDMKSLSAKLSKDIEEIDNNLKKEFKENNFAVAKNLAMKMNYYDSALTKLAQKIYHTN